MWSGIMLTGLNFLYSFFFFAQIAIHISLHEYLHIYTFVLYFLKIVIIRKSQTKYVLKLGQPATRTQQKQNIFDRTFHHTVCIDKDNRSQNENRLLK